MDGLDTFAAFAATYDSLDDAEADYEAIKALYYEHGIVDTFDAAVIAKKEHGKVKIVKKHEQPTRQGAWIGGGLGLAVGLASCCFPWCRSGGARRRYEVAAQASACWPVTSWAGHVPCRPQRGG